MDERNNGGRNSGGSNCPPRRGRCAAMKVLRSRTLIPVAAFAIAAATQCAAATAEPDFAYGEFQRGNFMRAFALATHFVETASDPKSMTLLGELYSDGYCVPRNDAKAAEW